MDIKETAWKKTLDRSPGLVPAGLGKPCRGRKVVDKNPALPYN